ncbi:MAG TPA: CHAT domain-containing tetratricopeptide repeat protein [Solirubrobacteraceae bacterium]|nr:CHAT domain-containing tetratricopeptide repeat protein [Solirubrobacteraceae bacterium]
MRTLSSVWQDAAPVPQAPADPAIERWVRALLGAAPDEILSAVAAGPDERVAAAVRMLLTRARRAVESELDGEPQPPFDDAPELLQLMVSRGHGTDFEGGSLAEAHAQMLIGLKHHLAAPATAHRAYELARLAYVDQRAEVPGRLAALASATVKQALRARGDATEARERLAQLREVNGEAAEALEQAFRSYEDVAAWIARVREGREDVELDPRGIDGEGVRMLEAAAVYAVDDPVVAARLARLAEAAGVPKLPGRRSSLARLADRFSIERRWPAAAEVLAELHARDPADREIAASLARARLEIGQWPEGRAVLVGLLGDPPGPEDVATLKVLTLLAYSAQDPDAAHWREVLVGLDPAADPLEGMPRQPGRPEKPKRLLAAFRDGSLQVDPALFDLPAEEQPAHMTAAIVAGSPDGREMLDQLLRDDPALGQRVVALLGLRVLTPEQARAEEHFAAAEEHFAAGRFVEARREYGAALRLDPDHVLATTYVGDTWYRSGAYHIAQAYFEESIAIEPSPQAHRFLGDAMLHGGHGARRARAHFERALALDPGYRGAREALAALEPETGEDDGPWRQASGDRPADAAAPVLRAAPELPDEDELLAEDEPAASERIRALEATGSAGDRLVAAVLRRSGEEGFAGVVDDDERFALWLSRASPDEIVAAIGMAVSVAFQYETKDRDVPRWKHWVNRQLALAEALPDDFGPADSAMELGRSRLLADALQSLATVREEERRLPEARLLYARCLELLDAEDQARAEAGLVGESRYDRLFMARGMRASVLENLARVCGRLGDEDAALRHRREAARLDEARPTSEVDVEQFIAAGHAAAAAGDLDSALGAWQHAVYVAEDEDPDPMVPRMVTTALTALGHGYRRLGTARTALSCFDRARELNERTGNAHRLARDHLAIAQVLRERPELGGSDGVADAREHLERALVYTSTAGRDLEELAWTRADGSRHHISAPNRAWPILLELGELLQERDDDPGAARFLTIATRIADLVRASLTEEHQRIAVQNERVGAYAELTKVHMRLARRDGAEAEHHARSAWLANESMRARTFLDTLGDVDLAVPRAVPEELAERERELLARRSELRSSRRDDESFWDEYREVVDELDALWQHVRRVAPEAEGYVEVRQARPADPDDLAGILAAAGRPVVLASLVQIDAGTLGVLALRGDGSAPHVEERAVDLARLDGFVRQNFGSAGRVRELAVDMEDLFQHELAPVGDLLTAVCDPEEILVVCPVGVLHHVPLGALRHDGRLLLERNPLASLPSASILRALRSAAHNEPATPAAIFGDPTGDLPGARAEAIAVAERFGATPALGRDASTDAVRRAMQVAGVLHVAGHAHFDPDDALASGLRLCDGSLTARDLIALQAPALSLVTLSACETGVIEGDAAEEIVGLTRALLFAGADSVVLSLWKVPDLATLDVMGAFYDGMSRGQPKVDALREAVLAARERHSPQRLDRWAGFQLVGDWQ